MFDPRSDIKDLFTSSRVTATDKYGNTAHVDIVLRENNIETVIVREGIIIFEQPRAINLDASIGDSVTYDEVSFDASLYVIRKPNIKDYNTFINSIVDSFQSTIRTSRGSLASCSDAKITNVLSPPVPPKSKKEAFRRVIEVTCWKLA